MIISYAMGVVVLASTGYSTESPIHKWKVLGLCGLCNNHELESILLMEKILHQLRLVVFPLFAG